MALRISLPNNIHIALFDTSTSRGYVEQIRVAAMSQIILSTHGAFESNVMYMQDGSLYIELCGTSIVNIPNILIKLWQSLMFSNSGNYSTGVIHESENYSALASLFLGFLIFLFY